MSFTKIVTAISTAAMLIPTVSSFIGIAPVAEAATTVNITGAALVRSADSEFKTNKMASSTITGTSTDYSANDNIQIFSVSGGSQCGAYYQFNVSDPIEDNEVVTLTFNRGQQLTTDTLHVISVPTTCAGVVGESNYNAENVFSDVSTAYGSVLKGTYESAVINVNSPVDDVYTVDITSIAKQGTNAIFVYSNDYAGKRYDIKEASINISSSATIWKAMDYTNTIWSDHPNNKNGVYSYVDNNGVKLTATADDNLLTKIASAGSTNDLILKSGVKYTLHYTLKGSWKSTTHGAYINVKALKADGTNVSGFDNAAQLNKKIVTAPGEYTCDFTPSEKSYGFFYFTLRNVETNNYVEVSNIYVTTTDVYTISFNSNGGSDVASETVVKGTTATEPTAPTKDGYTFGGWYTDSACTTAYDFSTLVTDDITLYAKWTGIDSDYYMFNKEMDETVTINRIVLNITNNNTDESGTATKNFDSATTICEGSDVDFYIKITNMPSYISINRIDLY